MGSRPKRDGLSLKYPDKNMKHYMEKNRATICCYPV